MHVTGSALVVGPRGIVLLKHRGSGSGCSRAVTSIRGRRRGTPPSGKGSRRPGCHCASRPTAPASPTSTCTPAVAVHTHLDLRYAVEGGEGDPAPPPDESQDVHWFDWGAAVARAEPAMAAVIRQLATGHRLA